MKLLQRLEMFGRETLGKPDVGAVLRLLHVVQKKSPAQIAVMFECTYEAVRLHLLKYKLMRYEPTFADRVKAKGYAGVEAFFKAGQSKTMIQMAKEIGMSQGTITYQYNKFLEGRAIRAANRG